jgi:ligand-binding sensor domain-containing protein
VAGYVANQPSLAQNENAAIIGTIQDDKGGPLANAKVTLISGDFTQSKTTQADGKFEFRSLKPAQYQITVEAAKFRKEVVTVSVRPDETLATPPIKMTPSSLHVAVLDSGSQPLAGVTVSLYSKDRANVGPLTARSTTDQYGDAYFARLAPGSYQLSATLRGYDEYRSDVFISSGITTEFPLQLLVAPVIPINDKALSRYSVPNLPSKNVQAVFQDSEGWLWFGTDKGIARFNGSEFKSSSQPGSLYEKLAGEDVRSFAEDRTGSIWLATSKGVVQLSRSGGALGTTFDASDPRQVLIDSRGSIWVATSEGLLHFDGQRLATFARAPELPSDDIRSIAEDKNGNIWLATAKGVATLEANQLSSLERLHHPTVLTARDGPINDARAIFSDAEGRVWVSTSNGPVLVEHDIAQRVARETTRGASVQDVNLRTIGEDHYRRVWFALEQGGVAVYDPARHETQRVGYFDRDRVAAIFTTREGSVWFATDNGVVSSDFYSFVSFTTSRGLADNDVQEVVQAPAVTRTRAPGRLWFLTTGGVSRLEAERFVPLEGFRAGISVQAVAFDGEGSAWFATDQGALRWTGETLTQFNESSGLASNNVQWAAAIDKGSAVIFATTRGASVFRDGALHNIEELAGYDVRHAFEDSDGRLWFATARGIVTLNLKTGASDLLDVTRGLADNDARWITRFNGKLLVATRAGIQAYTSNFTTFDAEPANTMYVDRDGYLWVGTDDGRVRKFLAFGNHLVSTLYSGEAYSLTGNRVNSISQDADGHIWISTNKGAVRHTPITVAPSANATLEVDGRLQTPTEQESQGSPGSYYVSFGRHRLIFRFSVVSVSGQASCLYRINSNGREESWEVAAPQQGAEHDVARVDLDEGSHAFELIALNRDLYGAASPAATLTLRVGLPFWKSWWFYALTIAVIGLALGAIFAVRKLGDREYVLPRELRSYVPIEPNPFIVGNPIRTETMFYGREDDFRYVRTKLEGANQGVVIVFCGERRVGKSSILYQVLNGRLGERFIPVFVDLQEMVIASDAEFFARVSRLIVESISRANARADARAAVAPVPTGDSVALSAARSSGIGSPAPSIIPPQFDGRNPYPLFLDFLDEAIGSIGDRTLLILMDEYELLEGKVDEGKLSNELFTFLAGLMDNKERLALIFTGSRRLEERDRKYWRELLRRSLFRKVGFLSEKDTVRLITEPVQGRVVYGRGVVDVIQRLTAGQPFYTQVMCQNVVDYMNEHSQNWLTLADLKPVITDIVDNPLPQMIYAWDGLSDDEKLGLSLLAETLADGSGYATAADLRTSVKTNDYPVNLSENSIRLTLEEMFRRELLEKDSSDGFRFRIDLLRLWIRRSHSIWQVVKEVRTL